jgi:hypothetical protein
MKIGVLQFFSWPERRVDLASVYARALQRIEIMDKTGYDAVWLAEHHFSSFSVCPSVHMMGMLAAARTTRLRIGTGVSLAGGSIGAPGAVSRASSLRISGCHRRKARRAFTKRSRSCCAPGPKSA